MKVTARGSYGDPDDYNVDITHHQSVAVSYGEAYPVLEIIFADLGGVPVVEIRAIGSDKLSTQLVIEPQITNVVRVYPKKRSDR